MTYLIEVPHNEAECLRALDEQLEKGSDILDKFYYGCQVGDHTGYAIVDANNEEEVRRLIPDFLFDKSLINEVSKFTPEMIRSYHKKAA
jgi:hypothetical protein